MWPHRSPGVVTVIVGEGDEVAAGATVATIEAMKMEAAITAPVAGTVQRLALSGSRSRAATWCWSSPERRSIRGCAATVSNPRPPQHLAGPGAVEAE